MAIQAKITTAPTATEVFDCFCGKTSRLMILGDRGGESDATLEMFPVAVSTLTQDSADPTGCCWQFSGTLEGTAPPRPVNGYFSTETRQGWLEILD